MKKWIPALYAFLGGCVGAAIALAMTPSAKRDCSLEAQLKIYDELGLDTWNAYQRQCRLDAIARP